MRHPGSTLFPYTTLFRSPSFGGRDAEPAVVDVPTVVDCRHSADLPSRSPDGLRLLEERRAACIWCAAPTVAGTAIRRTDRKSTRLNSSHQIISYAVFCLK